MPLKNNGKPATRADLNSTRDLLQSEIATTGKQLRSEIADMGGQLRSEIAGMGGQLRSEVSAVESRLNKKIERVAAEVVRTRAEMATKLDIADIKKHLNRITGVLDSISGQTIDNKNTLLIFGDILGDHKKILSSHDRRLAALEAGA